MHTNHRRVPSEQKAPQSRGWSAAPDPKTWRKRHNENNVRGVNKHLLKKVLDGKIDPDGLNWEENNADSVWFHML